MDIDLDLNKNPYFRITYTRGIFERISQVSSLTLAGIIPVEQSKLADSRFIWDRRKVNEKRTVTRSYRRINHEEMGRMEGGVQPKSSGFAIRRMQIGWQWSRGNLKIYRVVSPRLRNPVRAACLAAFR